MWGSFRSLEVLNTKQLIILTSCSLLSASKYRPKNEWMRKRFHQSDFFDIGWMRINRLYRTDKKLVKYPYSNSITSCSLLLYKRHFINDDMLNLVTLLTVRPHWNLGHSRCHSAVIQLSEESFARAVSLSRMLCSSQNGGMAVCVCENGKLP